MATEIIRVSVDHFPHGDCYAISLYDPAAMNGFRLVDYVTLSSPQEAIKRAQHYRVNRLARAKSIGITRQIRIVTSPCMLRYLAHKGS